MSGWNIDDDIMEDFSFTPAPETKAAKAPEPAAIATTHKVDYDGDIEMMDIEAPEDIQDVNDSILIARIKAKREPKKADTELAVGERITDPSALLVLDTSFILSHQKMVQSLVDLFPQYRAVVVFPWTTILELDGISKGFDSGIAAKVSAGSGLKDSIHNSTTREKVFLPRLARQAIIWMHEKFSSKSPAVWGQKAEEKLDDLLGGDDAILDCARFFHETRGHKTVMLSNDRNLCVKSSVYELEAISFKAGMTAEKILTSVGLEEIPPTPVSPVIPEVVVAPNPPAPSKPAAPAVAPPSRPTSSLSASFNRKPSTEQMAAALSSLQTSSGHWKPPSGSAGSSGRLTPLNTNISVGGSMRKKDTWGLPVSEDFWKLDEPDPAVTPSPTTLEQVKIRNRLGPFLLDTTRDLEQNLSRVTALYLGALGQTSLAPTNLRDIEIAIGTYAPPADLMHRAYRKRLTEGEHAAHVEKWVKWAHGDDTIQAPDVWDVRGWAEDMGKLWKLVFGPALNEAAKKGINERVGKMIQEATEIFEGK